VHAMAGGRFDAVLGAQFPTSLGADGAEIDTAPYPEFLTGA